MRMRSCQFCAFAQLGSTDKSLPIFIAGNSHAEVSQRWLLLPSLQLSA